MDKRIEIPPLIKPDAYGVEPAHEELCQKDADEDQVVEDEIAVYRVIGIVECRQGLLEKVLDGREAVYGIEDNQCQVEDQQTQHQKVDDKPDGLMAFLEILPVDGEHPLATTPLTPG